MMVNDEETVRHTVTFIWILGSLQPVMAIEFALSGSLRGAGDTRFPFYTVLIGMLGMRASTAALAVYLELPVVWVFCALIPDYIVKACLLVWRFRSERWQHAI